MRVHGHRGARAVLAENTLAAFEYAIGIGVDAVELDVGVSKDGVVIVSHDPYLASPICTGPRGKAAIRELTLAEIREWDCGSTRNPAFPRQKPVPRARVPTLDEVFELAAGNRVQFNVETKIFGDHPELSPPPDEFARLVLAAIRKYRMEDRVNILSFDFRTLHAMQKIAPEIQLTALWEGDTMRDFVSIAREAGAATVSPHHSQVTPEKVSVAHAAGLEIVAWTANTPADWAKLIASNVDAIVTDDPEALIDYLRAKGLR